MRCHVVMLLYAYVLITYFHKQRLILSDGIESNPGPKSGLS